MKIQISTLVILTLLAISPAHAFKYESYDNAPDFCIQEFNEVFKTIRAEDDAIYEKLQFEEDTRIFMDNYLDSKINSEVKARKTNDEEIRADLKNNWMDHEHLKATDIRLENKIEQNRQGLNETKTTIKNNQTRIEDNSKRITKVQSDVSRLQSSQQILNNRINRLDEKIETGLATVTALTALHPNPKYQGNTQITIGSGMYADNAAVAAGVFHNFNDRVMMSAGVSFGGDSSWAGSVGISIGL